MKNVFTFLRFIEAIRRSDPFYHPQGIAGITHYYAQVFRGLRSYPERWWAPWLRKDCERWLQN